MKKIFICAGELSGDRLGEGLILAVKNIYPDADFTGIAGPGMIAAGCKSAYPLEALSVMGLLEVVPKIPKILLLRHRLVKQLLKNPPDLYIGIDAPDFNLPIEAILKAHGIKTVHYVSPSIWAWRQGRIQHIKKSVDLLLSIFPFEKELLTKEKIPFRYIGHRSADVLPNLYTLAQAREKLNIDPHAIVITLLPGSRSGEINKMTALFLKTAAKCYEKNKNLKFIIAATNQKLAAHIQEIFDKNALDFTPQIIINDTFAAIKAANVVLATSGTVTLETFLLNKPMVVSYKMNMLSWLIVRALVKVKYCALPNLLANKEIVPEFLQAEATPEHLSNALMYWLEHPEAVEKLNTEYHLLLKELCQNADKKAAQAVVELLTQK